jgi:hypothetical protein
VAELAIFCIEMENVLVDATRTAEIERGDEEDPHCTLRHHSREETMTSWSIVLFASGLWWMLATIWRLLRPDPRLPLWLALMRDVVPAPLVGLLIARLL